MKSLIKLAIASSMLCGVAQAATVTLQISSGSNNATGFADASASTLAGLTWGVIVSSGGNSLFPLLAPGTVLSTSTDGISLGGGDYLFLSTNLTANQTFGTEAGVQGKISVLTGLQMNLAVGGANTVTTGDSYALVWFDRGISAGSTLSGGNRYGQLTDAAFVIPAAGATANHSAPFAGLNDPIKPAATFAVIPEPSAALLGAIGALGLLRRRRN